MEKPTPISVPELCGLIVESLDRKDLVRCVRVCKLWNATFLPFIWRSIKAGENDWPLDLWALEKHRHHVQEVLFNDLHGSQIEILSMELPNVLCLEIITNNVPTEFVEKKPRLIQLAMNDASPMDPIAFWKAVAGLQHLRHLDFVFMEVQKDVIERFWDICERLDTIRLYLTGVAAAPDKSKTLSQVKTLDISMLRGVTSMGCLALFSQCPNLTTMRWNGHSPLFPKATLLSSTVEATWPSLEALDLSTISDRDLSEILKGMRTVKELRARNSDFRDLSFEALRRHLPELQILCIKESREKNGFPAKVISEVLATCTKLRILNGTFVDAEAFLKDERPWVCNNSLTTLSLGFKFEGTCPRNTQPYIFERLSELFSLESLDISGPSHGLCLRLPRGLARLATLKRLRTLNFSETMQRIDVREAKWMLSHWTMLESVVGRLSYYEDRDEELLPRLRVLAETDDLEDSDTD
ncbi:hypothetical protein BGZ65_009070 [Modicella reniformis]|uniref:F-box domain-containing protein n=1 Tax=Modicella reniformis TaxID=1440133 RepID=A0A9P6LQJ3_9FUNG|nr:hypothetical protein BGZ65_009070 [Modicella reniformis]